MRRPNPFASAKARMSSCSLQVLGEKAVLVGSSERPSPAAEHVHTCLRAVICSDQFPCVGAKAALNRNSYRVGIYRQMADIASTSGLCCDLYEFTADQTDSLNELKGPFSTFIAIFLDTVISSEADFHDKLWAQLQMMRDLDQLHHPWAANVASDSASPHFAFSFATRAFFCGRT